MSLPDEGTLHLNSIALEHILETKICNRLVLVRFWKTKKTWFHFFSHAWRLCLGSEPKHILFFSHSLSLAPYSVGDCVAASLYCRQRQHCLLPLRFYSFLACGSSKFIHCFSSPSSSSVLFFCQWLQAVDSNFPKPLTYNLIFDVHPIISLWKNNRFPWRRYEHSY